MRGVEVGRLVSSLLGEPRGVIVCAIIAAVLCAWLVMFLVVAVGFLREERRDSERVGERIRGRSVRRRLPRLPDGFVPVAGSWRPSLRYPRPEE